MSLEDWTCSTDAFRANYESIVDQWASALRINAAKYLTAMKSRIKAVLILILSVCTLALGPSYASPSI